MCLQTTWKFPKEAKRDIIVYKCFSNDLGYSCKIASPFTNFVYITDKVYKTKITESDDESYFDGAAGMAKKEYEKTKGTLKNIAEGFHSAKTLKRLITNLSYYRIFKCIIPKGSVYYRGLSDLLVSNQIIVKNEILPKHKKK